VEVSALAPASESRLGGRPQPLDELAQPPPAPLQPPPLPLQLDGPQSEPPQALVHAQPQGEHQDKQPLNPKAISQMPTFAHRTPFPFMLVLLLDLTTVRV
jgi:hypothetical protein